MKKLMLLFCTVFIILSLITLSGCKNNSDPENVSDSGSSQNKNDPEKHEHSYGEWIEISSSCTDHGSRIKSCACGNSVEEHTSPIGHNIVNGVCSVCGVSESKGLEFSLLSTNDAYMIKGIGTCTDTVLILPSTYENLPVTTIGSGAFADNKTIKRVELSNTITDIKGEAFHFCSNLEYVSLPKGVKTIGGTSFASSGIKSVFIPESLTKITGNMFFSCESLETVEILNGISNIAKEAFSGCVSLKDIKIPDSVTEIGNNAFSGCEKLGTVIFGKGIEKIDYHAFYACISLTSVEIPNCINIGSRAFYRCETLTSAIIGDQIAENTQTLGTLGDHAFEKCNKLTTLIIGNGFEKVDSEAAHKCEALKTLKIGNNVKSIEKSAFSGCSSLECITVGKRLQKIHTSSFAQSTDNIKEVHITDLESWCGLKYEESNGKINRIHTGDNCTLYYESEPINKIKINAERRIGEYSFYGCETIEEITLSKKVKHIDNSAFENCTNLKSIIYEGTKTEWDSIEKGNDWSKNISICVVHCSDGDINLN